MSGCYLGHYLGTIVMTKKEFAELVEEFLNVIATVPFRAVDCDQDAAFELQSKIQREIDRILEPID